MDATPRVVGIKVADSWRRLLKGLWHSGLRLGEALNLYWKDAPNDECLQVDFTHKRPMLRIPANAEKGNKDRLLPMAPEFAQFLEKTPEAERFGLIFKLERQRKRYDGPIKLVHVSDIISRIGDKAGVVVNPDTKKCASAHDLRRAFGQRWAARVMPQILMQLMRHEDIRTTMKYDVGREAEATADVLWAAVEKPVESKPAGTKRRKPGIRRRSNTQGNTRRQNA